MGEILRKYSCVCLQVSNVVHTQQVLDLEAAWTGHIWKSCFEGEGQYF